MVSSWLDFWLGYCDVIFVFDSIIVFFGIYSKDFNVDVVVCMIKNFIFVYKVKNVFKSYCNW